MLKAMLALSFLVCLALSGSFAAGQASTTNPAFDVASVKPSQHVVGPELKEHSETRDMRVYELVTSKSGSKIRPVSDGETPTAGAGFHFHGDLRQFADLLAVQLSIPASDNPAEPARASRSPISVLDKTGLPGIFDFSVDIHPELGTDMFASWQRVLGDQLGLRIESRKENVAVFVVDEAARIPTEN